MHIDVNLQGAELQLFPQRAVFWPQHETLFVADTHLGKSTTFRRHGIPVPAGSTQATLDAISGLLETTSARQLVILGDMFHARSSLSTDVRDAVTAFFNRHAEVGRQLVRGNHDAHVGPLPAEWSIDVVSPGLLMENVALGHHPTPPPPGADLLLCGHLHPAVSLGRGQDRLGKLPCFWLSQNCLVLPAIGQFTGTHVVQLKRGERAWLIADDQLIEQQP
ncbi:ligase-associated DNA damage response endonuclease PdeM [Roseimaritima ulvae]|uniref:Calcineurin-like phosphoesterase domain-containing protein n=1 Tax=Roseimaritima ulvae TaxID=980254 RepID=A0A5B9QPK8_9BACT|nr:ligase-associated DNA damage response endonuclease PdeM [Roseimaritima ulvae]QEG40948.1 hypothetical protein UC8_29660 [Roseimaritima ulvae]